MLLLLTNPYLVNRFAQVWDIKTGDLEKNKVYSCAIILGGFSSGDDSGNGYFNGSADRFIQGLKLKNNRTVTNLLVVGGNSQIIPGLFNESIWVKQQLMQFNIPENNILIETRSRNTLENALFAKEKLRNKNLNPPYLLITSAFHMRRSMYSFQKQGLEVIPYTSNYIAGKSSLSIDEFIPQASVMGQWGTYLKEVIGFGIYYVKG
ncbi:MAG: YdcF family protein [Flavobacterium sp.]|nr:YdcF family protein [Pedobacter sp.]